MSNKSLLILLLIFYTLSGASITIINKHLYLQESRSKIFSHNWFLNNVMFTAEILGIPIYYILKSKRKKSKKNENTETKDSSEKESIKEINISNVKKIFYQSYPFIFDLTASFLANMALIRLPGSIQIMIKGSSIIIFTFSFSRFIMGNKHILDHYIALVLSVVGFIFVGFSAYFGQESNNNSGKEAEALYISFWIFVVIISQFIQAIQFCLEEHYMRKYEFHPFFYIGLEGLFGFIFNLILCIIFYYIKCGNFYHYIKINICTEDDESIWRLENVIFALEQILNNYIIIILIIFIFLSLFFYNLLGMSITKYGGAVARSLIENFRTFIVSGYFLFPWVKDELKEDFNYLRLIGLIFTLFSLLSYFELFKCEERIMIKKKIKALNKMDDIIENGALEENMSINSENKDIELKS